jgi:hypothetical protein
MNHEQQEGTLCFAKFQLDKNLLLLSNIGSFNPERIADDVADAFLADSMMPVPAESNSAAQAGSGETGDPSRFEPWNPDASELSDYTGRYFSPELETFYTLAISTDRLVAVHRRHGELELKPLAKDAFNNNELLNEVHFERDEAGSVSGLRVSNGRVLHLWFEKVDR